MAKVTETKTIFEDLRLIKGDVYGALDLIDDQSVDLVISSPPYNLGKTYERDKNLSLEGYKTWLRPVVERLCAKVSKCGAVCWQVGNFVRNGEVFPLDYFFYDVFTSQGFKLRNRIIWRYNFGLNATKRLSGRYETLLWLTKSERYTFNLDAVRVPQIYPGKRHSVRKASGKAGKPSGNPLGKNPSDFWEFSANDCFVDDPIWSLPNVKSCHPERTIHPCQFPHELAERCVLAFSNVGETVLDPFVGAGTTTIAALKAQRRSIGIDKDADYIRLTQKRAKALRDGKLSLRVSGLAVRTPSAGEAVARFPIEWSMAAE